MQLSENFNLSELTRSATADKKKINNTPTDKQIENLKNLCKNILQPIREKYGNPIMVTSGYRSPALNKAIKGATNSQHLQGEAADIKCPDNKKLWNIITEMIKNNEIQVGQLIDEKNLSWIHVSLPTSRHKNQIFKIK